MRRFCEPGNTLSEYAIIIGLLSLVSVGGLTLLGNSASELLVSVSNGSGSHSMQNYLVSTLGTGTAQSGGSAGNNAPLQGPVAVIAMPKGSQNASMVPNPSAPDINPLTPNTTGGGTNATSVDGVGMIQERADRLTRLVREIEADPNHDPDLLSLVTNLANIGHTAGDGVSEGVQLFMTARASKGISALTEEIGRAHV